jgi:hypothetical protein
MGAVRAGYEVGQEGLGYILRQLEEWDPRFSPRKPGPEHERLSQLEVGKEITNADPIPTVKLSDFEGRDFITSMSDRTDAGGRIVDINGVPLERPVNQWGGQDYMFNNPGKVWASDQTPVEEIMQLANGENPLFIPWRMTPTGGDYSTSTGETMLAFAHANMTKAQKAAFDKAIRDYRTVGHMKDGRRVNAGRSIDNWEGIDDPSAPEIWRNTPDAVRKEIMDKVMDKQFRNNGGLSIAEARLANVDPRQSTARDGGLLNIGEVYGDQPILRNNDHPSYNTAVPGRGLGQIDQDVGIFELLPDIVEQRGIPDPLNPRVSPSRDTRSLEMGAKTGTITPEILERLQARGVDVGNIDPKLLATMGLTGAAAVGGSLLMPNDAEAGVSSVFRHASDAARTFANRVPGDNKAPNPKGGRNRGGMTLEEHRAKTMSDLDQMIADGAPPHILEMKLGDFVHGQMDYDRWGSEALRRDGGKNGPSFLTGQDILNEELREIFPEKYHGVIDGYSLHRLDYDKANRQGQRGGQRNLRGEGFGDQELYNSLFDSSPTPAAPANPSNSAMADALRQAGVNTGVDRSNLKKGLLPAGVAAGGSGAANSAVPTSPEERGFKSWEEVSRDPTAPLPPPTWGETFDKVGDNLMMILDAPMKGWQGITRGLYGLANGEDLVTAGAQANSLMEAGVEEGADRAGKWVSEKTGDDTLGFYTKYGLLFGAPF